MMVGRGRMIVLGIAALATAFSLAWVDEANAMFGRRRCCSCWETNPCGGGCTRVEPCCVPSSTGGTPHTAHYGDYGDEYNDHSGASQSGMGQGMRPPAPPAPSPSSTGGHGNPPAPTMPPSSQSNGENR